MTIVRTLARSFAGGEIAPELFGRMDLDKYQTGLKTCRNFIALPYGPAQNRPGFKYVNAVKDSSKRTRLIPFSFSASETMVLEFGDQYIRFHTNGGTLLEATKAIASIAGTTVNTTGAHGYTAGQWVFIGTRFFKIASITDADTFVVTDLFGAAATPSGSTAARVYEVATTYLEADLFDLHYVQSSDVLTIVHPSYPVRELRRAGVVSWSIATVDFSPQLIPPTNVQMDAIAGTGTANDTQYYYYQVTSVNANGLEESLASDTSLSDSLTLTINAITTSSPTNMSFTTAHGLTTGDYVYVDGVVGMTQINGKFYRVRSVVDSDTVRLNNLNGTQLNSGSYDAYVSGGTATVGESNDLTLAGAYNMITWDAATDVTRYNVYKQQNGLYGYIGQTTDTFFKDDNIVPDMLRSPPELSEPFEAVGSYPSTVSYFDQRRCFAATDDLPQTVWMTKAGTESNLTSSIPIQDDDAIVFKIAAREQNRIRHLVPLSDLVLLTAGGEWRVFTGSGEPVTPATIIARPQSYVGANNVQPVVTSLSAIYVSAQGSLFRELLYDPQGSGSYRSEDLSVLTPHLVQGYTITDMAFSRAPVPMVWAVRSDGTLLGMTYLPEQKVRAWHQHDTLGGVFESVCCVAEGNEDVLYAVVKRTIDGQDMRYVERLNTQLFDEQGNAFFVDSGLTYSGAPVTTLTGLWHLEGEEVAVLGDGAVFPRKTVTNGAITLEQACSVVQIGLPIEADLETLPLTLEAAPALGVGYVKNIVKVFMRVYRSSGIFAGPDFDNLIEFKQRTTEPYGSSPSLVNEVIEIPLTTTWGKDGNVCVRQSDPLPLTVQTMSMEVAVGG